MSNDANFSRLVFFITHSHRDNQFVRRLTDDLYRAGLQGFCDLDAIKPGDNFVDCINQGLESCTIYVPVLSHEVLSSPWCKTEISAALELAHRRGREGCPRIISLLLEDCFARLPVLLRVWLQISFLEPYEEGLRKLLAAITGEECQPPAAVAEEAKPVTLAKETAPARAAQPAPPSQSPAAHIEPPFPPPTVGSPPSPTAAPTPAQAVFNAPPSAELRARFAAAVTGADGDTAITLGERLLQLDPTDHSVRRQLANAYQARGLTHSNRLDHEHALSAFDRAIALDPTRAELFLARGHRYHSRGNYRLAIADFTRALQLAPHEAACYFARGRSYYYADEADRALADLNQAVSLAPDEVYNYVARGESLYALGDYEAARADFAGALRLNPRAAHYYYYCLGLCHARQGDYVAAVHAYTQAITRHPQQVHYYIERGRSYRWQSQRAAGELDYERALRLDQDRADRYFDNTTKDYILLD